jgi:hypothetical protein
MGPGILAGLMAIVLAAPSVLPLVRLVVDACACHDAVCCCAPRKASADPRTCHGRPGPGSATLSCHESGADERRPTTIAMVAEPATSTIEQRPTGTPEALPTVVRAGFSRIDLPPPRRPASAS